MRGYPAKVACLPLLSVLSALYSEPHSKHNDTQDMPFKSTKTPHQKPRRRFIKSPVFSFIRSSSIAPLIFLPMMFPPLDLAAIAGTKRPEVVLSLKQDFFEGIPDGITALVAPVVVYWTYSTYFHIIDVNEWFSKYKIHPTEEQLRMNKVSFHVVLRDVLFQHVLQTLVGLGMYYLDPLPQTGYENALLWDVRQMVPPFVPTALIYASYWYILPALKMLVGFLFIDTWQFTLHRFMHIHPFLYKHFHSRHHSLYVPYAFGALFNNPVEGFLLDTLGTGLAALGLQMSPKEATFLYVISTLKTIDDHCGYVLPWHIFHYIFPNNPIFHDIHHQRWGIKYNFSQPYFVFWDQWFGTTYSPIDEYKLGKSITVQEYRTFLKERKEKISKKDI